MTIHWGEFQSTLPIRGATSWFGQVFAKIGISIHAPHTGSDATEQMQPMLHKISIHAPHTGSDDLPQKIIASDASFQSTLPIRGATVRSK